MAVLIQGGAAVIRTGVVRIGGQLHRRRVLRRTAHGNAGAFVVVGAAGLGHGDWRSLAGGAEHRGRRDGQLGVVRLGGQLRGRRGLLDRRGPRAFVVSQVHGTWGTAHQVPGTGGLAERGCAEVVSVSCASAGNCAVGGYYGYGPAALQAFVVSEVHGTWGKADQVPGTARP